MHRLPLQWLLPDLGLMAATVTLFYVLFLFGGFRTLFHDSDAGWHIRAGEQILRTGTLPRTDPFSFATAGKPWFAWEWLADLLVGTIHRAWGLAGVALFYATILASGVWLWFRLSWAAGGDFLLAAIFAIPMLSTTNLHWLARPHLMSWIFLLLTVRFAIAPKFSPSALAMVAVVSCLWANVHASFLLGPTILTVYGLGSFLRILIFSAAPGPVRGYLIAALVSLAATFVNPYGFTLHAHVLSYLSDSRLLDRVGEFQSFNFHLAGSAQVLLALAIASVGGAASVARKDLGSFLLIFFLLAMALRSARALPLVALLALPLANGAIAHALRSAKSLNSLVRKRLDAVLAYSTRLRAIDSRSSGLIWTPALLLLAVAFLRIPTIAAQTGFPPNEFPVTASATVAALPAQARILAPDKFGGYFIYRFASTRKVFFDGRSDLYGAQFLEDYSTLAQLRTNWRTILERYHFTNAVLPEGAPLIGALENIGWTPLYHDQVATVLAAPGN